MDEIDIAWAAGLFEGEGCFCCQTDNKTGRVTIQSSLTSIDYDIIERFSSIVSVGSIQRIVFRKGHKETWQWVCSGKESLHIFDLFKDYLGDRRKNKFIEILRRRIAYEQSNNHSNIVKWASEELWVTAIS